MDTLDAIRLRHSCRRYQQTDIRQYELDMLLQAAHAAPAACGRHDHLCLSVIQDQAFLEKWDHISAKYLNAPNAHPLYGARTILLISVLVCDCVPPANPYLNAGCMAENITLAATALGLGSVLLAAPVRALLQCSQLLAQLELREQFQPAIAVAVGYQSSEAIHKP